MSRISKKPNGRRITLAAKKAFCYNALPTEGLMKLIKLWEADVNKAYALHKTFQQIENGFENPAYGLSFDDFTAYVEQRKKRSQGIGLKEGYVPDTVFVLTDSGENYIGIFNLRHRLNEFLKNGPGHIGYGISPLYRNKGYASEGLTLTLTEAKKMGIAEVYLSCNKDNEASFRVQQKNGALLHHEDEHKYYPRILL